MSSIKSYRFPRRLVACLCLLAVLLIATVASAYGRVIWKSRKLKESESRGGSWKIELEIHLPRPPDLPTIPAKFEFKQTTYFERYKDDAHGDKPVVRRVPTPGKKPIAEGVDMGFLDPSDGKVQKRTKFSFKITRGHGFEAGVYRVTIRDARSGSLIGSPINLTLDGENKVIDRRSMVFASPKDKDKVKGEKKEEAADDEDSPRQVDLEEDESLWPEVEEEPPPPIEENPGGCGCRTAGGPGGGLALLLLPAAALVGLRLRRRRRR